MEAQQGLLVAGTTSDAGKTLVAAGICRVLKRRGIAVQPFKAVNMSLNSIPADDGGEIAVAQWLQSLAAGVPPLTLSNPVLLKSEGPGRVEIIVRGRTFRIIRSWKDEMHSALPALRKAVLGAVAELKRGGKVIVAEGAGSPVEVNLRSYDLANLFTAKALGIPVILVADLERGGAIAQIVGTLHLLSPSERKMVKGIILNRMRGDGRLLESARSFIEKTTGVPVLGVVPFIDEEGFRWPEEDSLSLKRAGGHDRVAVGTPSIGILKYPNVSNYLDFASAPSEGLRWVEGADEIPGLDALILPGSRRTTDDLRWMARNGIDEAILESVRLGLKVGGICGGYMMMGETLEDPHGFEGAAGTTRGLGLLPVGTLFEDPKVVRRVMLMPLPRNPLTGLGRTQYGYEIRRGRSRITDGSPSMFKIRPKGNASRDWETDGAISLGGQIWGTAVHGLLNSPGAIDVLLGWAKGNGRKTVRGGVPKGSGRPSHPALQIEAAIDVVADTLEESVGAETILRVARAGRSKG